MFMLSFLLARLAEPSTHAGIAALAQGAKLFAPLEYHPLCDGVTLAFGGVAVGVADPGKRRG